MEILLQINLQTRFTFSNWLLNIILWMMKHEKSPKTCPNIVLCLDFRLNSTKKIFFSFIHVPATYLISEMIYINVQFL